MSPAECLLRNDVARCDHLSHGYRRLGVQSGVGRTKEIFLLVCNGCGTTISTRTVRHLRRCSLQAAPSTL